MERTVRQQACEVTVLHQTINIMTKMLNVHTAREAAQGRGMDEWLADQGTKWDEHSKDKVLWETGMAGMIVYVLCKSSVQDAALANAARKEGRDETARQDGDGLETSQHAGAMQDGEPENCLPQQQSKCKPKLQPTLYLEPQY
jgi:hypothetical protein